MTEKLKNKINDEQLKIRAISDEKITVKLTNNYAFQKIFKNTKIVKGFLMALLDLKEYEIKKIEITDPFTLGENDEEKEGILDIKLILNQPEDSIWFLMTSNADFAASALIRSCGRKTVPASKPFPTLSSAGIMQELMTVRESMVFKSSPAADAACSFKPLSTLTVS